MVGNLGGYQLMVQAAKAVGGPERLVVLLVGAGAAIGGAIGGASPAVSRKVKEVYRNRRSGSDETPPASFTVENVVRLPKSPPLRRGETFSVIAQHGDTVVLRVDGRSDNPHAVSLEELSAASDIPADFTL